MRPIYPDLFATMAVPKAEEFAKSVRRGGLVGLEPLSLKIWLLVRDRPAARIITENNKRPTIWMGVTRVAGRTRTMSHNTLVVDLSIRKPGKSSKTAKRPAICMGVRPGELVGLEPCSITLWWLVRVRPAPPRSCPQPENSGTAGHPGRRRIC